MSFRYFDPVRAINGGTVYPGAWLSVTQDDELVALYADPLLQTRLPNPVRANAAGRFPPLYAAERDIVCSITADGDEVFSGPAASSMPITVGLDDPRDDAGELMPLATLTFFDARTTELVQVYGDEALTVPLTNPVAANSSGAFPAVYTPLRYFRVQLHKAPGNPALVPADLSYQEAKHYIGGPLVYDVEVRPPPPAPVLSGVIVEFSNKLTWTYALAASAFRIYRAVSDGGFEFLAQVSGSTFTYVDSDIAPATIHHYRVTAVVLVEGAASNEVMLAPLEYGTPGVLRTAYVYDGSASHSWTRPANVNFGSLLMVGPGGHGANQAGTAQRSAGGGGGGGQVRFDRKYSFPASGTVVVTPSATSFDDLTASQGGYSTAGNIFGGGPDSGGVGQSIGYFIGPVPAPGYNISGPQTTSGGFATSGGIGGSLLFGTSQLAAGGGGGGGAGGNGGAGFVDAGIGHTKSGDGGIGVYHGRVVGVDLGDDGWFAGGGSGAVSFGARDYGSYEIGAGGKGGGGTGEVPGTGGSAATNGTPGTGGGGGGGTIGEGTYGEGGTGIVVMVYYDPTVYGVDYWPYED